MNGQIAGPVPIDHPGPFQGWMSWGPADPWEAMAGPFYFREEQGGVRCAFVAERKHLNVMGVVHGGCLLTFADFALFAIAYPRIGAAPAVTVTLQGDFVSAGRLGDRVEATGDVTRSGKGLVFVRGLLTVAERPLVSFSGIIRRLDG